MARALEKQLYYGLYRVQGKEIEKRGSRSEYCGSKEEFRTWCKQVVTQYYQAKGIKVTVTLISINKF